jgi:hypothetical protein
MITPEDLKTKTARELIVQTESIDLVLDAIISYIKTLEQRIEKLENR